MVSGLAAFDKDGLCTDCAFMVVEDDDSRIIRFYDERDSEDECESSDTM